MDMAQQSPYRHPSRLKPAPYNSIMVVFEVAYIFALDKARWGMSTCVKG